METKYIPITVYGRNSEKHTQVDISEEGIVTEIVLNDELQLDASIRYSTIFSNELILFYSLFEEALGIRQKNLVTGSISLPQNFCFRESTEDFKKLISNEGAFARLSFDRTQNGDLLHLDIYDDQLGLPCSRIDIIDSSIQVNKLRIIDIEAYDDHILVNYSEGIVNRNYLAVVDLTIEQVVHEFVFDSDIITAFIIGDEIYISTAFYKYQVYSVSDFTFKRDFILPGLSKLGFGLIHPNVYQNQIVAEIPLPQPSAFGSRPGIFDIETGNLLYEMSHADLSRLDLDVQLEIVENFELDFIRSFERFAIDAESETIVFAYKVSRTSGVMVFADYSGNIMSYVPVPVNPERIILR